ncbi:hypothetical protein DITRI_Ditri06bG0096300 [Diplodiscus trichospermus]
MCIASFYYFLPIIYLLLHSIHCSEDAKPQSNLDFPMLNSFCIKDLEAFTHNFNRNNLIGLTQFGQLYRGKLEETEKKARSVTIKKWSDPPTCYPCTHDINVMLNEELKFLTHPSMNCHPNLVKLIGYCYEEQMKGVVYDLNPMDTLHNVMTKDIFGWIQRIKVALALACLLKFLHKKENSYLVQNVDTAHIILDQDYNSFIVDFGLMSRGIIGDMTDAKHATPMTPSYCDIFGVSSGDGTWTMYSDVYSYGVIVIELMTKRITEKDDLFRGVVDSTSDWASKIFKFGKSLEVHPSLQEEQCYEVSDGRFLVELGKRCIEFYPQKRPSMRRIVMCLECMSVVKNHGNEVGF